MTRRRMTDPGAGLHLRGPLGRTGGVGIFGYRPALDGLRTVAVALVVAFHARLGPFGFGSLGVDVFFVLSGFLVTHVLLNELQTQGTVRLPRFFARRIRRLVPAALVTILATCIGLVTVLPDPRDEFADDATGAALWFANLNAIDRVRGGIDRPSPLLHFWSLSIEEHFYLLFPLLVLAVWALGGWSPRLLPAALLGVAAAGALAQVLGNQSDPTLAYYFTPLRIYQMLAGAGVAAFVRTHEIPRVPRVLEEVVAAGSLTMIVALSIDWIPALSVSLRGLAVTGIVSVLLVALTIGESATRRLLSSRVLVYLGGLSYAIYLFHVPIGVLAEYQWGTIAPLRKFVVTGVGSVVLAALSSVLVEQPIRRSHYLDEHPEMVIALGIAGSALVGLVLSPLILG